MNADVPPGSISLLRDDEAGISTLTLNRPAARNALSEALIDRLHDELAAIGRDKSVRVVVLAASGPVFCAGHDLKEMTSHRGDPDRLSFLARHAGAHRAGPAATLEPGRPGADRTGAAAILLGGA